MVVDTLIFWYICRSWPEAWESLPFSVFFLKQSSTEIPGVRSGTPIVGLGSFSVWAELVPYSLLVMTLLLRGSPLDSATGQSCPALVCKTEFRQKFQLPHSNVVIEHVSGKPSRFQHHFPNHLDANAASATRAALAHCVPHSVNFIEIHLVSFSAGSQS